MMLGHSLVRNLQAISKSLFELLMSRDLLQDLRMFTDVPLQRFVAFWIPKGPTIPNDNLSVSKPRVILTQAFGEQIHVFLEVDWPECICLLTKILITEF